MHCLLFLSEIKVAQLTSSLFKEVATILSSVQGN